MEVKAKARYIRMSPRKVRLVIDVIRGMGIREARTQLQFMKKAAAEPVLKLLNSAVANAQHNFDLNETDLIVKEIMADGGPTLGRWRARAFGRAAPIRKRTTHISITLAPKTAKTEVEKEIKKEEEKKPKTKAAPKTEKSKEKKETKKAKPTK